MNSEQVSRNSSKNNLSKKKSTVCPLLWRSFEDHIPIDLQFTVPSHSHLVVDGRMILCYIDPKALTTPSKTDSDMSVSKLNYNLAESIFRSSPRPMCSVYASLCSTKICQKLWRKKKSLTGFDRLISKDSFQSCQIQSCQTGEWN